MKIKYVVPSYKRPDSISTPKYLKKAVVFVSEIEIEEYRKNYPDVEFVAMPKEAQGHGKGVALNWVLNYSWDEETDAVIVLDDDIECLNIWKMRTEPIKVDEDGFYEIIENTVLLAQEFGCGMFGFNATADTIRHHPETPFHLHRISGGQCLGFVRNDGLRFDERFLVNEDIDIQLQSLKKYHKILNIDSHYLTVQQWKNPGGCQEIRTEGKETDRKYRNLLADKWGHRVITMNKKQIESVGFTLRLPLEGT